MKQFLITGNIFKGVATVTVGDATEKHEVENEWEVYALFWLALLDDNAAEIPREYRASLNARIQECAEELWSKREVYKLIMPEQQ